MLIHLIYSSVAVSAVSDAELQELLITSRRNNARNNITGMLLYADSAFFQAIEGEEQAVLSLYERLTRDKRHHSQTLIIREPIAKRAFADWAMGCANLTDHDMAHVEGVSDFLETHQRLDAHGAGRARKLLAAFSAGRWRTRTDRAGVQTGHNQPELTKRVG